MTARPTGAALVLVAGAIAASPFMRWYRADLPGRDVTFRGTDVTGELWSLPGLAVLIAGMGVVLLLSGMPAGSRPGRWIGGGVTVAGIFALGWAADGIFGVQAVAVPRSVLGPEVPLGVTAVGWLAAGACAIATALGLLWLRSGAGRPAAGEGSVLPVR